MPGCRALFVLALPVSEFADLNGVALARECAICDRALARRTLCFGFLFAAFFIPSPEFPSVA